MRLTLYTRPECHLCDQMKAVIRPVVEGAGDLTFEEIDISGDAALIDRYGLEVPVLTIDGRKVAKYRTTETDLRRILEGRRRETQAPSGS